MLAALAGCAVAPAEAPPVAVAAVPPPCCACECAKPAAAVVPAAPSPATRALTDYRETEKTIAPAVTSGTATASYIRDVDRADKLARSALRGLVAQDGHPTPDAIAGARRSLDDLIHTLETPK
jgi:hypothetical protein